MMLRSSFSIALGFLITVATALAGDVDQLEFQQKNAQAQMQELQERMYRLSELTREAEPDDAARLLMAVRKAREQLIIEQMMRALDLLSTQDFTRAADEQAQVIRKLEELKKLLTSTDIDLQLQLEKLRALNRAIQKLDSAIKEEKRQQKQSNELAAKPPADAKPFNALQQDQQQNRKATESIAQAVKDLATPGGTAAAGALGGACQSMSLAEGSLSAGKPSDAQSRQGDAIKSMREARQRLQEERKKILEELERQVRRQVVENLTEMLERQRSIRGATETIIGRLSATPGGQRPPREMTARIKQLGGAETAIVRIADQTIALIEETQFSVALPPALKRVQQKCALVAAQLEDTKADAANVAKQKQIERDLQDLLDTFKQLASSKIKPGGNCNCKGDKNKLLAELKVVRMMQARANEETRTVNDDRGTEPIPPNVSPMLREKILAVRDVQADARDAMARIQEQLNAPDDAPPDEQQEESP